MAEQLNCVMCIESAHCLFKSAILASLSRPFPVTKRATVYCQGQPADAIFMLCSGSVKLVAITSRGYQRIAGIIGPGSMFGLDSMLPDKQRVFSAIARENCTLRYVHSPWLTRALRSNPDLLWQLSKSLNVTLHATQQTSLLISGDRVRRRVLSVLSLLDPKVAVQQTEIAEMLGVSVETINREIRSLSRRNLITILNGRIFARRHQERSA